MTTEEFNAATNWLVAHTQHLNAANLRLAQDNERLRAAGRRLVTILEDKCDYRPDDEDGNEYAEACDPFLAATEPKPKEATS